MGKNHKHLKSVKSEKGKVKLRLKTEKTKFLPKGLNVTKTDFKIKPIVLIEQLKGNAQGPQSKHINIKEALSKFNHHNASIRLHALEDLTTYLQMHRDNDLGGHIADILKALLGLLLDSESKVRATVIKLLDLFVFEVPEVKMQPFYALVSSYLRCAMTDINISVQEDSLLFLNVLLRRMPSFVREEYGKVLVNLISLISKLKSKCKSVRTLNTNLERKTTGVKWRVQVLETLHVFLQTTIALQTQSLQKNQSNEVNINDCLYFNPYVRNVLPYKHGLQEEKEEEDQIKKSVPILMTLFYESWLEVGPSLAETSMGQSTVLFLEQAETMLSILETMGILLQYLNKINESDVICTPDWVKLMQHFSKLFPYSSSKELTVSVQQLWQKRMLKANLLICLLSLQMKKPIRKCLENQHKFINDCLVNRRSLNEETTPALVTIIEKYLKGPLPEEDQQLILLFLKFYERNYKHQKQFSHLLNTILDNATIKRNPLLKNWIINLDEQFVEDHRDNFLAYKILQLQRQNLQSMQ